MPMKRATAKQVSTRVQGIYRDLNALLEVVQVDAPDDFERIRDATSKALLPLLTEILNPLYVEFPELSPKEMRPHFSAQVKPSARARRARR